MANDNVEGILVIVQNIDLPVGTVIPVLGPIGKPGTTVAAHTSRETFYEVDTLGQLDQYRDDARIRLWYRDRYADLLLDGKTKAELEQEAEAFGEATQSETVEAGPERLVRVFAASDIFGGNGAFTVTSTVEGYIPQFPAEGESPALKVA